MIKSIQRLGSLTLELFIKSGRAGILLFNVLYRRPRFIKSFPLVVEQLFFIGILSLLIIIVSGAFVGMVISLQGYNTLVKFGAEAQLGQLLALSVLRELGPVLTALLFAGRAGSALTAELGLMKATEQLSAMEVIGVDPVWRIVSPRFWAGIFSLPFLTLIFNMVSIFSGGWLSMKWLGVDEGNFWSQMQSSVSFHEDVVNGIIKSVVFGIGVVWVAIFQGIECQPTAEGIARSTTKTVVYASLLVLGLDFILTIMMMGNW